MGPHYLTPLFSPESIAVFGANSDPDSVGGRILWNLWQAEFQGTLFAINPKHAVVGEFDCHASLASVGQAVDLAVITTPSQTVPEIMEQCGEAGVRAAIIISAGFAEAGEEGKALQESVLRTARKYGIRFLGPNCLGLMRPEVGLNAAFGKTGSLPGEVALISQSGALCTAIVDWANSQGIGFSAVVSTGDAADLDFGHLLDFFASDRHTRSILLYIEGIHESRAFLSGLRAAARLKPVIVLKAGRHSAGAKAAVSHTAALVGADNVFDAALERAGAVRVDTIDELFSAARILSGGSTMRGRSLAVVTNAGGAGVIAADCAAGHGLPLARLSPATTSRLEAELPSHSCSGNPVDVLGDAGSDRYRIAIDACAADHDADALVVMLTPQGMTDPVAVAHATVEAHRRISKPVVACWMGGTAVDEAHRIFAKAGVPAFRAPESAVAALAHLAEYRRNQELLIQTPGPLLDRISPDVATAKQIVRSALDTNREVLTEAESKRVLECFHIPVVPTVLARSAEEAALAAERIGFPVVLKIDSPDITHKSEAGGVELNLRSAERVRERYEAILGRAREAFPAATLNGVSVQPMHRPRHGRELIAGVVSDPVFGPTVSFGAGGVTVEIFKDQAIALPPLNEILVRALISKTRAARLLGAFRNMPPVEMEALTGVLLRISEMVCELPEIAEMDINPLVASPDSVMALDARIRLQCPVVSQSPYSHMAICPYPHHLEKTVQLRTGETVLVRPVRPEDAQLEQTFIRRLSEESRYFRFMNALQELTPRMLVRFTQIDYDREMSFLATAIRDEEEIEIGMARYTINPDNSSCEFAIVVADEWHGKGVATELMNTLMAEAKTKGLQVIEGEVLTINRQMLDLCRRLGFRIAPHPEDPSVRQVCRDL